MEKIRKKDKIWIALMELGAGLGCHQMEDRSFSFHGYQFPLCARCTGVLCGEISAITAIISGVRLPVYFILVFCGIMGADWSVQRIGLKESTNIRRFISGIFGGFGVTYVYFYVLRFILLKMRK